MVSPTTSYTGLYLEQSTGQRKQQEAESFYPRVCIYFMYPSQDLFRDLFPAIRAQTTRVECSQSSPPPFLRLVQGRNGSAHGDVKLREHPHKHLPTRTEDMNAVSTCMINRQAFARTPGQWFQSADAKNAETRLFTLDIYLQKTPD